MLSYKTFCVCLLLAAIGSLVAAKPPPQPTPPLLFSTGFTDNAVIQRGEKGVVVYGFAVKNSPIMVTVNGKAENGSSFDYTVSNVLISPWVDTTGCNETQCVFSSTHPMPQHGDYVWRAELQASPAHGGNLTITVSQKQDTNISSINITNITYGDVFFCSGQSNMALELYYTFSAETLRQEVINGNYSEIRTFEYGFMSDRYEAPAPQYVITWDDTSMWYQISESAKLPPGNRGPAPTHSPFAKFSATCMYFGVELIKAKKQLGLESGVPIGLMQSAIGGTMIESWLSNSSRESCANLAEGGNSALYHAMVAPFVNYSVAGWLWYQGENNCHGEMGNVLDKLGYGCAMPALVSSWRDTFRRVDSVLPDKVEDERIFGIVTLAAGGSEGAGNNMAGMRWSQTANFGRWTDNPFMPNTFGAQAYDIGDPWSNCGDGNQRVMNETACEMGLCKPALDATGHEMLDCCWSGITNCSDPTNPGKTLKSCSDKYNCSLPEPATEKYGSTCAVWDTSDLLTTMQFVGDDLRKNSPSGTPGNNFMGGIHPRLKRPLGQRLGYAAAKLKQFQLLSKASNKEELLAESGALTGPTIAGCTFGNGQLEIRFNTTLLGGEGLQLRPFDANETGGWSANPYNDSDSKYYPAGKAPDYEPTYDSLGLMVCTDTGSDLTGNASTCECQGWDWVVRNQTNPTTNMTTLVTVWFCKSGPGWKPDPIDYKNRGKYWPKHGQAPTANMYREQWQPVGLKPGSKASSVLVNLTALNGKPVYGVRLAWPLIGGYRGPTADTCCPTRAIQDGHGICLPGNCPLYSAQSNLPANPFFAAIQNGRCVCMPPQNCSA
eukprot:m.60480 g.60480  ORF g.60480 m.60480 type:complete len:832 (+) comp11324_c0_seq1:88-2583(+)